MVLDNGMICIYMGRVKRKGPLKGEVEAPGSTETLRTCTWSSAFTERYDSLNGEAADVPLVSVIGARRSSSRLRY